MYSELVLHSAVQSMVVCRHLECLWQGTLLSSAALQALYTLACEVAVPGLGLSDSRQLRCGIRTIHSVVDAGLGGHVFYVNRQKVPAVLGN